MQDAGVAIKECGVARDVEPDSPMSFEREAAGAEGILARANIAVAEEATALRATEGAAATSTYVGDAEEGYGPGGDALQQAARYMVEYPADKPLPCSWVLLVDNILKVGSGLSELLTTDVD